MAKITKAGGPSYDPEPEEPKRVPINRPMLGVVPEKVETVSPEAFDKFVREAESVEIVSTELDSEPENGKKEEKDEFADFDEKPKTTAVKKSATKKK